MQIIPKQLGVLQRSMSRYFGIFLPGCLWYVHLYLGIIQLCVCERERFCVCLCASASTCACLHVRAFMCLFVLFSVKGMRSCVLAYFNVVFLYVSRHLSCYLCVCVYTYTHTHGQQESHKHMCRKTHTRR